MNQDRPNSADNTRDVGSTEVIITQLRLLGMSTLCAECYCYLQENGSTTVNELAAKLHRQRTNVYPALNWLEQRGFVMGVKTNLGPTYYSAVYIEDALHAFGQYQRRQVISIIRQQRARRPV